MRQDPFGAIPIGSKKSARMGTPTGPFEPRRKRAACSERSREKIPMCQTENSNKSIVMIRFRR